jgi:hypothetical protein
MPRSSAKSLKTPSHTLAVPPVTQNDQLSILRDLALRLVDDLNRIAAGEAHGGDAKDCDSVLLRKGDGVIDGLNKLSQILVRIAGKGRYSAGDAENADAAANANAANANAANATASTALDKAELERRIAAEVDRIAAARGEDTGP